ncbi:MAG TPA: MFS transporter [Phenylobacterium sp.]|jgi:MFS family permease|nr:MFS transporter [Phenylobacterium sp.]
MSEQPAEIPRTRVLFYMAGLMLLVGFGSPAGGLIDVPISFFLKNKLHLAAHEVANFKLAASIPLYVGMVFGFARDRWNLFGRKDRGMLIVFGLICAAVYAGFAAAAPSYLFLTLAVLASLVAWSFTRAAEQGLASMAGQQLAMTGWMSVVWSVCASVPYLTAYAAGGLLSQFLEGQDAARAASILFLVGAGVMALVALYGVWKPKPVYDHLQTEESQVNPLQDLGRLLRHWPVYPALACYFLWSFAPGSGTPLQYYLQNTLHASDLQWGEWNAIFAAAFIPTYLLYGALCRRFTARTLLFVGTFIGIPQFVPLYLIHSVDGAMWVAAYIGLTGGLATSAYIDLLMRSAPRALQGTIMMAAGSLYWVAIRFGDVLGTNLYDRAHSFGACVIAVTLTYALILPVILTVPRRLISTREGEPLPLESTGEDLEAVAVQQA